MYTKKDRSDRIPLVAATDEEGMKSGYDTFVERSDFQATATSLLLTGPRSMLGSDKHVSNGISKRGRPVHNRTMSFAETVDPITLSWNNINVYANITGTGACGRTYATGETKQLLNNASGVVQPGTLLGIMGPSGAGKSTLLNVLTYRNRNDLIVDGEVKVNGQPVGRGIKSLSAYIQQTDLFFGNLKVREHLWFHAQLRMDTEIPIHERDVRIDEVMMEMGLTKCAETFIGIPGSVKGISGGEMKRLSFACEVLTNPPLMFCDEITSGLDSFMAENVLHILKAMTKKDKTIVCTIHQPSSEAFSLFDNLLLLAEGHTVYHGKASSALDFFRSCGHPCPLNYNPADHFVHCLATEPGNETECHNRVQDISNKFKDRPEYRDLTLNLREIDEMHETDLIQQTKSLQEVSPYKAGWTLQMKALVWRAWVSQARDINVFAVRILQTVIIGLLMGTIYFQQKYDDRGVMNINGALFLFLTNMTYTNFYTVLNAFPYELPIFYREHHNGMYRVDAYFLSKNIAEFFIFILLPTILILIPYWMVGFNESPTSFLLILLVNILVAKAAVSLGYLLSTACGRIDLALAFSPPLLLPLMLFGGYMLNLHTLSPIFGWLQWISWYRYAYEVVLVSQWHGVTNLTCVSSTSSSSFGNSTHPGSSAPCYANGTEILNYYGFNSSTETMGFNFIMLVVLILCMRFLGFLSLWIRARESHK